MYQGVWLVLFEPISLAVTLKWKSKRYLKALIGFEFLTFVFLVILIGTNASLALEVTPFCTVADELWVAVKLALKVTGPLGNLVLFCPISKAETGLAGLAA